MLFYLDATLYSCLFHLAINIREFLTRGGDFNIPISIYDLLSEVTSLTTAYQPRIVIILSKPITSKVVLKSNICRQLGKYYDYFAKFLLFAIQVLNISCRYSYP